MNFIFDVSFITSYRSTKKHNVAHSVDTAILLSSTCVHSHTPCLMSSKGALHRAVVVLQHEPSSSTQLLRGPRTALSNCLLAQEARRGYCLLTAPCWKSCLCNAKGTAQVGVCREYCIHRSWVLVFIIHESKNSKKACKH